METIARQVSSDPEVAMQSQAMELLAHLDSMHAGEMVDDLMFQHLEGDATMDGGQMAVPSDNMSNEPQPV